MRYYPGKFMLIFSLSFLIVFSPLIGATAERQGNNAYSTQAHLQAHSELDRQPQQTASQNTAGAIFSLLQNMFAPSHHQGSGTAANAPDNTDENNEKDNDREEEEKGKLDILLETTGEYFEGVLEDERLEKIIEEVLDDIEEDERIEKFDPDDPDALGGIIIEVLRDEKLARILGNIIGDYLADEEFLMFVETITADISYLLKDDEVGDFLANFVIDFLSDERLEDFLEELLEIFSEFPEELIENLQADENMEEFIAGISDVGLEITMEMLADENVSLALERLGESMADLPSAFLDPLMEDEDFRDALDELEDIFADPMEEVVNHTLDGLVELMEDELMQLYLDNFLNAMEEKDSFQEFMEHLEDLEERADELMEELEQQLERLIELYEEQMGDDVDDPFDPPDDPEEEDFIDAIMSEEQVEDVVAEFLEYWIDIAAERFEAEMDNIEESLEDYFQTECLVYGDEDSDCEEEGIDEEDWCTACSEGLYQVIKTALETVENAIEDFQEDEGLQEAMDEHMNDYAGQLEDIIEALEIEERIEIAIESAIEDASLDELADVAGDKQAAFEEALRQLPLGDALEETVDEEEEEVADFFTEIIEEFPFDELADMLTPDDVRQLIDEFLTLIDGFHLEELHVYLEQEANELGFTIAESILHGLADDIEEPPEPELHPERDEMREEVMDDLLTDERLRQFYIDLGADPAKLDPELKATDVVMDIITKAIEKGDRLERFEASLEKRAEPFLEDMSHYGRRLGERIKNQMRRALKPLERIFDPLRRLFPFPEDEERLSDLMDPDKYSRELSRWGDCSAEFLTESKLPMFVDDSLEDFLTGYEIVEDVASPERFTVLNEFLAEIATHEEAMELEAVFFAEDLLREDLISLGEAIGEISPGEVSRSISDALLTLIPEEPMHLTLEDAGVESEELLDEVVISLEEELPEIQDMLGESAGELLPTMLETEESRDALEQIMEASAEPVMEIAVNVLRDPDLNDALKEATEEIAALALQIMDDTAALIEDERAVEAVENLMVDILADEDLLDAIGKLGEAVLSEEDMLDTIELVLEESILESTYGRQSYYDPREFETVYITVFGVELIGISREHLMPASYWGLYGFQESLMEWLREEPEIKSDIDLIPEDVPSLQEFVREFPREYLTEERVRDEIAGPLISLGLEIALDALTDEGFRGFIADNIREIGEEETPLQTWGTYLSEEERITYLMQHTLSAFPFEDAGTVMRENDLEGLIKDGFDRLPLEDIVLYLEDNEMIAGILRETEVTVDPDPLRRIFPMDPAIAGILLDKAERFPGEVLVSFFREDDRAYRLGYTLESMQARFTSDLLTHPNMSQLQSDLVIEKVNEADHTLAERLFDDLAIIAGNERLSNILGNLMEDPIQKKFDTLGELVRKIARTFLSGISSLFGGTGGGSGAAGGIGSTFLLLPLALVGINMKVKKNRARQDKSARRVK